MKRTALAVLAAGALVVAGCSGDDDDEATDTTSATTADDPGTQGEAELVADATSASVAYFQARAVHDFDAADDQSTGSAELVIDWDEAISEMEGLEGTPYEIDPVEAPSVRVEISGIEELDDGRLSAEGFVELGQRPDGVATTSTTEPPEGAEPDDATYVTEMVFTRDGEDLRLDDYRFDDVPYPVSELYVEGDDDEATDATTEGTAPDEEADADEADVELRYGHRDVDGSVQWIVDHDDDAVIIDARFLEGEDVPEPGQEGVPLAVFPDADTDAATTTTTGDDDGDDDDGAGDDGDEAAGESLVVQEGAFPGLPGTMRLDVQSDDESGQPLVVDVEVLEFPELGEPRPTNAVRDSQADVEDTTTTTEPEEDETTTTTESDEPTTTTTAEDVSTTTTAPTTSTTMASTTTSTEEE